MATYEKVPANVVYASRAGVLPINTASPQSGPDSSAVLQQILNQAQNGPLELVIDVPCLAQQLSIYSGTTIRGQSFGPECGVWMSIIQNGTNSCIFKNAHWASPHPNITIGNITDQDIVIKDLYLNGQYANGVANNVTYPYQNTNGQYISPIQMYGVKNLRLENLTVDDPASYHTHSANINGGVYKNINFLTPGGNQQTDGIHLNGPCVNILIDGVSGTTGDDFVALNAVDGNLSGVLPVGPGAFGGFGTVYYGSITNVVVQNLLAVSAYNICRMLQGNDPALGAGVKPATCADITVRNVVGSCGGGLIVNFYTGSVASCIFSQINIENWLITQNSVTGDLFNITGGIQDLRIANIRLNDVGASGGSQDIFHIAGGGNTTITDLTIDGWAITEDASEINSPNVPLQIVNGTIDTINIKNCSWNRHTETAVNYCNMTGGTVQRINMVGCNFNNINSAISVSGGTLNGINCVGLSHRNANSHPSINVGTGITVARLRASGSDTANLYNLSAGTITSVKTDATEDS